MLRCHRHPLGGVQRASKLGIGRRTVVRDIACLQGQGARIDGEAGVGYVLLTGCLLRPLKASDAEIEVLVRRRRWSISNAYGSSLPGANCARVCATFGPIAASGGHR